MLLVVGFVLPGSSPSNTFLDEAGIDGDIDKASDACHALDSSLSGLDGLATVPELRMSRAALDRLGAASSVEPTNWHSVGARVETAT